ncbi:uncharacterized protein LOC141639913 [Silene latifolia]|uniref:uncharacterized protein LOC141639913 n=1 Tax=Silene latifolia TaxID=37657 RepID=UPI003D77FBB0
MPKDAGGLGVKKVEEWNWAAVGKLVNWVYTKADRLWIRWIKDQYILKEQDWQTYSPPADAPWTWKNVCKVKEKLKDGFGQNYWLADEHGYTLKNGYKWLCTHQAKVDWYPLVWNSWNIPKHSVITWFIMQEGLNTKAKLYQIGFCEDNLCLICGEQPETINHLFYECHYGCRIRAALAIWMGRVFPTITDLMNGRTGSLQWKAMAMIFNVYLYMIWHQRNFTRLHQSVVPVNPDAIAESEPVYKITPCLVADLYGDWIMPLTKKVQVAYLLRRLD